MNADAVTATLPVPPTAATARRLPNRRSAAGNRNVVLSQILLVVALFALWELAIRAGWAKVYLYGQPSGVWSEFVSAMASGALPTDAWVTTQEAVTGFVVGSLLGSCAGLSLWLLPTTAKVLRPLLVALNGLPKIALAPLIVVWFGIGMESKVALASIITFIVAMITSHTGTKQIDPDYMRLLQSLGASRWQVFHMIVVPGSIPWIVSAFRLNIGFALIGAVVGEYISADKGLGHYIYYAGTLYKLNAVWTGIFALMVLALVLDQVVGFIERRTQWA